MLDFDSSRAVVGLPERQLLIRAVLSASAADETQWLEWKSSLDMDKAHGQFTVAKGILGFANRMPDVASRWAEGHAYLLVGVEPGNLCGTPQHDGANLFPWINKYAGESVRYDATYVPFDAGSGVEQVLFVDVSPPQWGDSIHALQKTYQEFQNGTIFVRLPSRTVPHRAVDIEALSTRLIRREHQMDIELAVADGAFSALHIDELRLEEMLDAKRDELLSSLPRPRRAPSSDGIIRIGSRDGRPQAQLSGRRDLSLKDLEELGRRSRAGDALSDEERQALDDHQERWESLGAMTMQAVLSRDMRSPDVYREEVDAYIEKCRQQLPSALCVMAASRETPLRLRIDNESDLMLHQVQVTVIVSPGQIPVMNVERNDAVSNQFVMPWPEPPPAYGEKNAMSLVTSPRMPPGMAALLGTVHASRQPVIERPEILRSPEGLSIQFPPVDLRARASEHLPAITLFGRGIVGDSTTIR
ncbi:helix-turn-helix domain-containing protein [Streptomyces fructofermentans]|uniref:helix-turn-helix domain-containing protein n=1 Tax=Streptomyces fructofermentans TaxID=152141 RepID=UPI00378BFBC8